MPDPTLQAAALRYAAGDLAPPEAAAFEARLGTDQDARDALAEAVRLSARALGQEPPAPDRTFRAAIRERLTGWCPAWLARRAYRGHPAAWAALGAAAVAACTVVGLALADREPAGDPAPPAPVPLAVAPAPRPADTGLMSAGSRDAESPEYDPCGIEPPGRSIAEVWADLSTPDHVEKAHDDEQKWRDKLRGLGVLPPARAAATEGDRP